MVLLYIYFFGFDWMLSIKSRMGKEFFIYAMLVLVFAILNTISHLIHGQKHPSKKDLVDAFK